MDFKGNHFWTYAGMAAAEYVTKVQFADETLAANYGFRKTDSKLVMLGETEEYEPLSRAAVSCQGKDQDNNND
jgi:thymidine kinase